MPDLAFPHLFIQKAPAPIDYWNPIGGGKDYRFPDRPNREGHANKIRSGLEGAWSESQKQAEERNAVQLPTRSGAYIDFESAPGFDLKFISLEARKSGIALLNVREDKNAAGKDIIRATVFVPTGKLNILLNKIERYRSELTKNGNPKEKDLIEGIDQVRHSILQSFWYDPIALIPKAPDSNWCEVWLRIGKNPHSIIGAFRKICSTLNITLQDGEILFPERAVVIAKANENVLEELLLSVDHVAEFRRAKEAADFWTDMPNAEQAAWVNELAQRLSVDDTTKIAVCVVDTGVNNGHPLLAPILPDEACLSVDSEWNTADEYGHGTMMCGTVAFGQKLGHLLKTKGDVVLPFKLESVKLIRQPGQTHDQHLYGDQTIRAISRAEIAAPDMQRAICLTVSSEDGRDNGRPSSWSAAIDAVTAGVIDDTQRLCIVSAGNVADPNEWKNYPDSNATSSVHDPAQAWNALSVGAVTFMDQISNPEYTKYLPLAAAGQLSPYSATSAAWDRLWPNKPDIIAEGGNVGVDETGFTTEADELSILSVHHRPQEALLSANCMTSAACGLVAEMAARLWAQYPDAWPETIRGLLVHSARWPEELRAQFTAPGNTDKAVREKLLRVAGYGVPNFARAEQSARDSLTLIAEQSIQPFCKSKSSGFKAKDMHLYELPWPIEALNDLPDETPLRLDVTLSYFIQPGPGEKGWRDKYRYRSHGLDFNINKPTESREEFVARLNKSVRDSDDVNYGGSSVEWEIGDKIGRSRGSIHRDWVQLTAAQAKACNNIGVFPRTGWWKERDHLGLAESETRYSLIISLSAPEIDVGIPIDLYTPVAVEIAAMSAVPI